MSGNKILVVEKDASMLSLIETRLQARNYEVFIATHSDEAARLARKIRFDLILISAEMERIEGLELCQKVKRDSANFSVPVILLAKKNDHRHLALSPERGFDDFMIKPFDAFSLQLRVELNLLRARERLQANPLTNLPGTMAIEENIKHRNERKEIFSVCYIDINHFKSFNDRYGFERGDAVIRHTARLIQQCVEGAQALKESFVGHIGGDDYIVVLDSAYEALFSEMFLIEFDHVIPSYYDEEERKKRTVSVKNRNGVPCQFPLMSVCVAAVTNQFHPYETMGEIARDVAEVKSYLKTQPGSHYLRDRRAEQLDTLDASWAVMPEKEPPIQKPKLIGQVLLEIGLITNEELTQAVRVHVETGERIGQVLIRMNVITSGDLGRCLGEKFGVEYVNLEDHVLTEELAEVVSDEMVKSRRVIPISIQDDALTLAMVEPLNRNTILEIEALSGRRVEPKLTLENEFDDYLEKVK